MPAAGNPKLSAQWLTDPSGAAKTCGEAITAAGGYIEHAAVALGVGERTLWRWLDLHPEIRIYCRVARPGRPKKERAAT